MLKNTDAITFSYYFPTFMCVNMFHIIFPPIFRFSHQFFERIYGSYMPIAAIWSSRLILKNTSDFDKT